MRPAATGQSSRTLRLFRAMRPWGTWRSSARVVGPGVTHVSEGDRVGVPWLHSACGHCSYCWSGWETLCEAQKNSGYSVNGAFAEYVLADADYIGHLPCNVDFVQIAPILCAGITVYKGLKVSGARPGD